MISVKKGISIILLLCSIIWVSCVTDIATGSGGIGHEGEAKIFGKVVYADSDSIPKGAAVYINATSYVHSVTNAQRTADTFVDDSGYFFIKNYPKGNYTIEINDGKQNAVVIHCEINSKDTEVVLTEDTLRATSIITGKIIGTSSSNSQVHIYLKGLERVASVNISNDSFTLYDIPPGEYEIIISIDSLSLTNLDTLTVEPSDSLFVNYKYVSDTNTKPISKTFTLNTSGSGANIKKDIYNFPLLISLNQTNFDFSQPLANGEDIYFSKTNGQYIPFEIEYWNTANQEAAIWVLLDTILANNTTQSIMLHWGEGSFSGNENKKPVFDTSSGFQGVWHLSELNADTVSDATSNNFYGVPNTVLTDATGKIGYAKSFNGVSDYIVMPTSNTELLNFPENGTYSLSAWIYVKALDTLYQPIITKSNRAYGLQINDSANIEFFEYSETTSWNLNRAPINSGNWYLITGIRNEDKQYLYVNGVCSDSVIFTTGNRRNRVTNEPIHIGKRVASAEGGFFNGYIDEVRIHNRVLDPEWIWLTYINQSLNSNFIKIR